MTQWAANATTLSKVWKATVTQCVVRGSSGRALGSACVAVACEGQLKKGFYKSDAVSNRTEFNDSCRERM